MHLGVTAEGPTLRPSFCVTVNMLCTALNTICTALDQALSKAEAGIEEHQIKLQKSWDSVAKQEETLKHERRESERCLIDPKLICTTALALQP